MLVRQVRISLQPARRARPAHHGRLPRLQARVPPGGDGPCGGHPPAHRMYAKLVLRDNGAKEYLRVTPEDLAPYERARKQLASLTRPCRAPLSHEGWNTRQILNYGYRQWHELFNERQLLALTILAQAIADLPKVRPAMTLWRCCSPASWSSTTCSPRTRAKEPARCGTCSRTTF